MASQPQIEQREEVLQLARWSVPQLLLFRFCVMYFGLFCLGTQILGGLVGPIPKLEIPDLAVFWPIRQIVFWTAAHVFLVKSPLVYMGSGSGDKTFDWVLSFCLLVCALLATVLWSILDRRRTSYRTLGKWFLLFLRFALASEMILYGVVKVIPLQMPFPHLAKLMQPYGTFSPMGVLWSSVGASPAYEMFAGWAEVTAGILLSVPRTATLGALICLVDLTDIFVLNMTYDVPVKLFSFHLILMTLFLLTPEFTRLISFFVLNRAAPPSLLPELFQTRRANRRALAAQVLFGVYLLAMNVYGGFRSWHEYGGGRVKPPLYGIWNVEEMSLNGQPRLPLLTDSGRWRRAIFDMPSSLTIQSMDDLLTTYRSAVDLAAKTLTLTRGNDKNWKAKLTFQTAGQDQLTLDGDWAGQPAHLRLKLVDQYQFLLVKQGFRWIQEYPFNR